MLTDLILPILTGMINSVYDIVFGLLNVDLDLTGLASAVNFLGGIVYTTSAFVPYETFGVIFGVLFALASIRYAMQVVNLLWP